MGHVAAILSDFDGTLCPTSSIKYDSDSNFIPRPIEDILCEISLSVPICIISSKDLFHLSKNQKISKNIVLQIGFRNICFKGRKAN